MQTIFKTTLRICVTCVCCFNTALQGFIPVAHYGVNEIPVSFSAYAFEVLREGLQVPVIYHSFRGRSIDAMVLVPSMTTRCIRIDCELAVLFLWNCFEQNDK
jgi:hypothetical protein